MKYEKVTMDNFKAASNAEWEIRTQGFIEHQMSTQRYNAIRAADEASLNARRRNLAAMLAAESKVFQSQLEALSESPEERKTRMESRASELKEKRETEVRSPCCGMGWGWGGVGGMERGRWEGGGRAHGQ